jgi:hypothetical protein
MTEKGHGLTGSLDELREDKSELSLAFWLCLTQGGKLRGI